MFCILLEKRLNGLFILHSSKYFGKLLVWFPISYCPACCPIGVVMPILMSGVHTFLCLSFR